MWSLFGAVYSEFVWNLFGVVHFEFFRSSSVICWEVNWGFYFARPRHLGVVQPDVVHLNRVGLLGIFFELS